MGTEPDIEKYAEWPAEKRDEIIANWNNRKVGSRIVSETDKVRVWHLVLKPGERAPFHRHDEPYFWTSMASGKSLSYYNDGSVKEADYEVGTTAHFDLGDGKFFVHDLNNIGDTVLKFVTVEFKS